MALKRPDWNRWLKKLKNVYRFQIVDEKSYDVKLVMELNRLNVIVVSGVLLAFFTLLNFLLIAFTPLKEYIPGYGSGSERKDLLRMSLKAQELEERMNAQREYVTNLQNILNEKVVVDAVPSRLPKTKTDTGILSIKTADESRFVQGIEKGLQNADLSKSIQESKTSVLKNLELRKPVSGSIRLRFSPSLPGITFNASENETVYAVLDGTVVAAGNSMADGYYLVIQAENQLVYLLKNNAEILKKTGNFVHAGDAVAIAGREKSSNGFASVLELWYKGQAIDASKYLK